MIILLLIRKIAVLFEYIYGNTKILLINLNINFFLLFLFN
jgi:hypothetical protein